MILEQEPEYRFIYNLNLVIHMLFTTQIELNDDLWAAIKSNYESGNYQSAILDAIFSLTKEIRDRTDLDLDGHSLIGKVFGGDDPMLKINAFATENDRNEQKGIEAMLRGLFQGIRNPRAHSKTNDNKNTCDSIIILINYLYTLVLKSKEKYSVDEFAKTVLDGDFVEDLDYVNVIMSEIPLNRIDESVEKVLSVRSRLTTSRFSLIINGFYDKLSLQQKEELSKKLSSILESTNSEHDVRLIVAAYEGDAWARLSRKARLRTENKMLKSFDEGFYNQKNGQIIAGALGTWISSIYKNLIYKDRFKESLIEKITSEDGRCIDYVINYFGYVMSSYVREEDSDFLNILNDGLVENNKNIYNVIKCIGKYIDIYDVSSVREQLELYESKISDDNLPF